MGLKGFGFGAVFVGWGLYCRYIWVRGDRRRLGRAIYPQCSYAWLLYRCRYSLQV